MGFTGTDYFLLTDEIFSESVKLIVLTLALIGARNLSMQFLRFCRQQRASWQPDPVFYKAFGNNLHEYFELLAMPRELIMFRSYFEKNGTTEKWQTLYRKLNDRQKERLMALASLNVSELRNTPWPNDLKDILEFYLIKYSGETEHSDEKYFQLSLMDDSDVVVED